LRWGSDGDVEDEAVEAAVADEEIAAAAQDEDSEVALAGKVDGFQEFGFCSDLAEEPCGAADTKGGVRGKRNLLLNVDGGHGLESTTRGGCGWRGGRRNRTIGRGAAFTRDQGEILCIQRLW